MGPAERVSPGACTDWERRSRDLERLNRVGVALSAERNKDRLVELILLEATLNVRAGKMATAEADLETRIAALQAKVAALAF